MQVVTQVPGRGSHAWLDERIPGARCCQAGKRLSVLSLRRGRLIAGR